MKIHRNHTALAAALLLAAVAPFAQAANLIAYGGFETGDLSNWTLSSLSGSAFQVSFWLELQDSATPDSFSWSWNGVAQALVPADAASFGYTKFSAIVGASGAATSTLSFSLANPQSFWLLDDVTVSAVPEPGSMVMAGTGVALLALVRRRRPGKGSDAARS